MSLFAELKRRNVIRVGVAYLVGAWLLLQVTDVLMSVLGLPAFTGRLVFALLVIGFVPALVFSWAYQVTPEGLRRDTGDGGASVETARNLDRATIAMLVVVAGLVVFDRFLPEKGPDTFSTSTADVSESVEKVSGPFSADPISDPNSTPSLAVLPFANMSPDPENEYFADGISEELLNLLVRVEGLRVPSRTSSFAYKGLNKDIREIARELQVDHILEGSVRKAGNQVRITAQLIDTNTDTHLWSQTWDRELADIFAIQEEIANHIVEALKGVLAGGPIEHRPTDNLEAYTLFLQGRHLFQQRGPGIADAARLLERAVELDPGFAEAWATLAVNYTIMPNYVGMASEEAMPKAEVAANRALQLEPDNVIALLALGPVETSKGQLDQGLELYERAVRVDAENPLARLWLGLNLMECGYSKEALGHLEVAARLEPTSGIALDWLARALVLQGRFDEALAHADAAMRLGRPQGFVAIMQTAMATDNFDIVKSRLTLLDELVVIQSQHMESLTIDPSRLPEALAFAATVKGHEQPLFPDYLRLSFFLAARNAPEFFAQLRKILAFDHSISTSVWVPYAAPLRQSPLMQDWIEYLGLDAVWRQRGAPDLCTLEGAQWQCK